MPAVLTFILLCVLLLPASAQSTVDSGPAPAPAPALRISSSERAYFELGYVLSRAAFSCAPIAKRSVQISQAAASDDQVDRLSALAPEALRERGQALENFNRALELLRILRAPSAVGAPLVRLSAPLNDPPALTGDAAGVAAINRDAGLVLATLQECGHFTEALDSPGFKHWLTASPNGQVWYAEGLLAGVAEVAWRKELPELLPSVPELATDLRGLRDWLALRLPETPTPEQAGLQASITAFLQQSAQPNQPRQLTPARLQALGMISRMLKAQILPSAPAAAPTPPPVPPASSDPAQAVPAG